MSPIDDGKGEAKAGMMTSFSIHGIPNDLDE
jgi:hypothetical protein